MAKKGLLVLAAIVAGILLATQTPLGSYAELFWNKAVSKARRTVSIDTQLERARQEVAKLSLNVEKHKSQLARDLDELEQLNERIAHLKSEQKNRLADIRTMRDDLKTGATILTYGGKEYPASRIQEKLSNDLDLYERMEQTLKAQSRILEARQKKIDAQRQKLREINGLQQELLVRIAQLEADLEVIRVAEVRSNGRDIDEARLADIRSALTDVERQLSVKRKKLELDAEFSNDPIPVREKSPTKTDALQRADALLEGDKPAVAGK